MVGSLFGNSTVPLENVATMCLAPTSRFTRTRILECEPCPSNTLEKYHCLACISPLPPAGAGLSSFHQITVFTTVNGSLLFLGLRAPHGVCALSNGNDEHEHELEANSESEDKAASNPRIAEPGAVMRLQLPRSLSVRFLYCVASPPMKDAILIVSFHEVYTF
ncbi:hypothetical protein ARMSODRAFT_537485 [Armillaria solidipes]|uniref:Uncharacterized protein n=1 Tax=Armillaria solidipes TaxID=1076256 RepID=A0A2H3AXU6_9AGAR|nr:hypothetical protein ARMSODRAFT_537485 [Armillaria solidipes]